MKDKKKKAEDKIEVEIKDGKVNEVDSNQDISREEMEENINEVDETLLKLNKVEEEKKELQELLLRRMAEFENYKRRTENEQSNLIKYAAERFITNMLPIYDDLERSLNHMNEENKDSLIQGLKMVFNKFSKVLEEHGVKRIEGEGKEFDFNFHEALMRQENDKVPADTVLSIVDNGYTYKDKVIKHAKVIVSTAPTVIEQKQDTVEENNNEENS